MAEFVYLENDEKLMGMSEQAIMSALTELAVDLKDIIVDEVPKRDGNLAGTTMAIPAEKINDDIVSSVKIGDRQHPYAWAVWQGIPESVGQIHEGNMHFPLEKWPQWNPGGGAEPDANGWFHFRKVRHIVPGNDFIGRAIRKLFTKIPNKILSKLNITAGK